MDLLIAFAVIFAVVIITTAVGLYFIERVEKFREKC